MNLVERAREGYGRNAIPVRSHRASEYEAIAKISHRLRSAALDRKANYPAFAAAISDNRKLWSILAIDVAQAENGLPDDLRGKIFWLAEFTEAESRRLLRGQGDVGILIEINAAILQGLGMKKETA